LQLTIEKLVYGGDGLARLPVDEHGSGKTVFLPFVLEDEKVEARLLEQKPSFARAQAERILEPSAHRTEPGCTYFQRCGGCHYQHSSYDHQLEIKASILKENLRRLAKLELATELEIHPSPPWNYRNRTRLKVQAAPAFALGFYKFNSHQLLPVEQCPISSPLINQTLTALWDLGRSGQIAKEIQEIEIFADSADANLLIELYCDPNAPRRNLRQCAEQLQAALPHTGTVVAFRASTATHSAADLQPVVTIGGGSLTCNLGQSSYRVSAGAFFQSNRYLIGELLKIVTDGASGETAFDLYAGVGLFSKALAGSFAQVFSVESSQTSFSDLHYNLLGRHIGDRAHGAARAGQVLLGHRHSGVHGDRFGLASVYLGQTKVENLGVAALGNKNVRRLNVTMNDALRVSGVERVRHLDPNLQNAIQIHGAIRDQVLQGRAVEKLHHDERLPVLLVNLVDGADVRMVQPGSGLGFPLEAAESLRVLGHILGQELEGNKAIQFDVFGLVDDAHATAAELLDNPVVRNGLADHGVQA